MCVQGQPVNLGILASFVLELKFQNLKKFRTFEFFFKIRNCIDTLLTQTVVCPIKYPTCWFLFHLNSPNRTGVIAGFVFVDGTLIAMASPSSSEIFTRRSLLVNWHQRGHAGEFIDIYTQEGSLRGRVRRQL